MKVYDDINVDDKVIVLRVSHTSFGDKYEEDTYKDVRGKEGVVVSINPIELQPYFVELEHEGRKKCLYCEKVIKKTEIELPDDLFEL